ncbi:hypothetical protein HMI01_25950 [Halolactibacillus miurensis]|uniref:Uncharacterized protein n=1 Tax=Halolactibacillus miurensis TaxID=306541 RepID=A0A1I6UTX2_9BACI|nr:MULTISPECIES: hypothetical protein [Halolactibacillus]GEM05607.1 hypothetical protein HMI01_25950 [Halolactibacillus miurensis]SFT04856.1 hypothetical protein SAMN05421668_13333 [Halolactibacillus miurensis]
MYQVLDFTGKEIFLAYVVIISASLVLYPLTNLVIGLLEGVAEKWR